MNFFDVVKKRHSIRSFKSTPIGRTKLNKILEASHLAPSAGDLKAREILLVELDDKIKQLAKACFNQKFISEAPLVLVFCMRPNLSSHKYGERGKLYALQDATIAASYAQLAATALGLGSCWVGAINESAVMDLLELPDSAIPICVMPIGYPAGDLK